MKSEEIHDEYHDNEVTSEEVIRDPEENDTEEVIQDPEENEGDSYDEVSENEVSSVVAYDYTSYFQNIENHTQFQSACLVAVILLLGLLMGLKKHD